MARRAQGPLARFAATLRLWRRRIHERQALASLTDRELADFGATTADVYRELGHAVLARAAAVLGCCQPRNPRSIER